MPKLTRTPKKFTPNRADYVEVPATPANPTGLCDRLCSLERRSLALRGAATRLASETADLAADTQSLVEDLRKVGL